MASAIDRARLGYVVDYADLHFGAFRPFMIFNIADAAITIGVLLLLARVLIIGDKAAKSEDPKSGVQDGGHSGDAPAAKTENDNA